MNARFDAAVIVPAHNGAATIEEALHSIEAALDRSDRRVVTVVVDDASTDDTARIADRFGSRSTHPFELLRHPTNRGTGAARNSGVTGVDAGAYLFLDQDDAYLPDHVAVCLDALDADRACDYVRTGVLLDRPVHADWHEVIADSLVQTIGVRAYAHRLIGGFIEDRAVATVGCDDVYYRRLLARFLRGRVIPAETVRFRHRPGNSFERQWERKFSRPLEAAEDTLTGARLDAMPGAEAAFETRLREVRRRVNRLTGR